IHFPLVDKRLGIERYLYLEICQRRAVAAVVNRQRSEVSPFTCDGRRYNLNAQAGCVGTVAGKCLRYTEGGTAPAVPAYRYRRAALTASNRTTGYRPYVRTAAVPGD